MAIENTRKVLGSGTSSASRVTECVRKADVLVTTTPWPEFREIQPESFERHSSRHLLVDCWGILDPGEYSDVADYVALGLGT